MGEYDSWPRRRRLSSTRREGSGNGSMMMMVLGAIVLLTFLLGFTGVVSFLNQDYQNAASHVAIAPVPLQSVGCCMGPSLECLACREKMSTTLICLKHPGTYPECPEVPGLRLGNGELIRANDGKILDADRLTVSAWVRTNVGGTVVGNRIASCAENPEVAVAQYGYLFKITEHGRLSLTVGTKDHRCFTATSGRDVVPFDQWVHIGFLMSNDEDETGMSLTLFVNGVEVVYVRGGGERELPRFRSPKNVFTIGSSSDGLEGFTGVISDVQVYHGSVRSALVWPSAMEPREIGFVPDLISSFLLLHYSLHMEVNDNQDFSIIEIKDLSGTGRDGSFMSGRYVRTEEILKKDHASYLAWVRETKIKREEVEEHNIESGGDVSKPEQENIEIAVDVGEESIEFSKEEKDQEQGEEKEEENDLEIVDESNEIIQNLDEEDDMPEERTKPAEIVMEEEEEEEMKVEMKDNIKVTEENQPPETVVDEDGEIDEGEKAEVDVVVAALDAVALPEEQKQAQVRPESVKVSRGKLLRGQVVKPGKKSKLRAK